MRTPKKIGTVKMDQRIMLIAFMVITLVWPGAPVNKRAKLRSKTLRIRLFKLPCRMEIKWYSNFTPNMPRRPWITL
jgi:hypothetical protein